MFIRLVKGIKVTLEILKKLHIVTIVTDVSIGLGV